MADDELPEERIARIAAKKREKKEKRKRRKVAAQEVEKQKQKKAKKKESEKEEQLRPQRKNYRTEPRSSVAAKQRGSLHKEFQEIEAIARWHVNEED